MSNDTTTVDGATPSTEAPTVPQPPAAEVKPTETVEFWKAQARENEKRAKANADAVKELDKLKQASMTELERAIAEAKTTTRSEVLREVGSTRVADVVRVAAAGRPVDIEALLDGLDRTRFLDDDGQPDSKAISAWVDRIAPPAEPAGPVKPRVPVGVRDSGKSGNDRHAAFAKFIDDSRR